MNILVLSLPLVGPHGQLLKNSSLQGNVPEIAFLALLGHWNMLIMFEPLAPRESGVFIY